MGERDAVDSEAESLHEHSDLFHPLADLAVALEVPGTSGTPSQPAPLSRSGGSRAATGSSIQFV